MMASIRKLELPAALAEGWEVCGVSTLESGVRKQARVEAAEAGDVWEFAVAQGSSHRYDWVLLRRELSTLPPETTGARTGLAGVTASSVIPHLHKERYRCQAPRR